MMNITKRFEMKKIVFAMIIGLVVLCAAIPSHAAQYQISKNNPTGFSSSWQRQAEDTRFNTTLTYGYNTDWINEDYSWAEGSVLTDQHQAYVKNANGVHTSSWTDHVYVAKIEVVHSGNSINYKNIWTTPNR